MHKRFDVTAVLFCLSLAICNLNASAFFTGSAIYFKRLSIAVLILFLVSCKLVINTDSGGTVVSASGDFDCATQACSQDIPANGFADTFTAVPNPGHVFAGWEGACVNSEGDSCTLALPPMFAALEGDLPIIARFTRSGAAPNPSAANLIGKYAVRTAVYTKQNNGGLIVNSKNINYSLMHITDAGSGELAIEDQGCYSMIEPGPGSIIWSWVPPELMENLAPAKAALTSNGDGSWTRQIAQDIHIGWEPDLCTPTATRMPPYNRTDKPNHCSHADDDSDGNPGISININTSPPAYPSVDAGVFGATLFGVSDMLVEWTITPDKTGNGMHKGTVLDAGTENVVIGCSGVGCVALGPTALKTVTCPEEYNVVQFIPIDDGTNF